MPERHSEGRSLYRSTFLCWRFRKERFFAWLRMTWTRFGGLKVSKQTQLRQQGPVQK
jgi:hypothetical protein